MEIRNVTDSVSEALARVPVESEVESLSHAEIDMGHVTSVLNDPRSFVKAAGLQTSDESQIQVTLKHRAQRKTTQVGAARRVIVIVVKYRNCDADVIIIVSR